MKNFIIILITLLPSSVFAHYDYFLEEFFFGRLPSARAEAMGRAYVSMDGDVTCGYFNPAGVATLKGFELAGSYSSPYYLLNKANYFYASFGYRVNEKFAFALSRNYFSYGEEAYFTDDLGNPINSTIFTPYNSAYTLTASSEMIRNFSAGININYLATDFGTITPSAWYGDIGFLKKFRMNSDKNSLSLGASLINFTGSKMKIESYYGAPLPEVARLGVNYSQLLDGPRMVDSLELFRFIIQAEGQKLIHSDLETAYRFGGEFLFSEIVAIRLGFYRENIPFDANGGYLFNQDDVTDFTFGFGMQLPLYKFTSSPLKINFDYTSLPQPVALHGSELYPNFNTYTLRINYFIPVN